MATANQLEDILNSDVDESKLLSLVGSLESKLSSQTVREPTGQISTTPLNSNHISRPQIVSTLPHTNLHPSPATLVSSVSNPATIANVNGSKLTLSQANLVGINSVVTSPLSNVNVQSRTINIHAHQNPGSGILQNMHTNIDIKSANAINKCEPNVQLHTGYVKQELVTVGSTNTGTVSFPNASTTVVRTVLAGNGPRPIQNSHSGSSGIYDLASVASEQKPLSLQAIKNETKPVLTSLPSGSLHSLPVGAHQQKDIKPSGQSFVLNVVGGTNVPGKQHVVQTVVKQEPSQIQTPGKIHVQHGISPSGKSEVRFISPHTYSQHVAPGQSQLVSSPAMHGQGSIASAVLKTNVINTGSTVITRATRPMSSPQAVTVLRSPALTHASGIPQTSQTIQIVNLNNSASRVTMSAPSGISAIATGTPKPLAPRIVTASGTQVKIAPQHAQQMSMPMRHGTPNVGGSNLVLPPNCQLPPGTMLVKNEHGQLMIVSQPQHAQAQGVKSQPRPQVTLTTIATHPQHVIPPTPSPRPVMAPQVSLGSLPRHIVSAAVARSPIMTQPGVVTTGGPVPRQVIHSQPGVQHAPNQTSLAGNQGVLESVKKCKNFLSTLLKLASQSNQPPQTIRNVKELIQGLVDGRVPPEVFTAKLQVELKSSPQPYLVPFLKKSLPLLRQSLVLNKMHIDGVKAPPQETPNIGHGLLASSVITHPSGHSGIASTVPHIVAKHHPPLPSEATPQLRTIVKQQRPTTSSSKVSGQQKHVIRSPGMAAAQLGASPSSSKVSAASAGHKEKRKYEAINRDDDDINDVATMGGVNLSEESRNILATNSELMAGQLRSCKDETFLHAPSLMCRINAAAKKFGMDDVPNEVVNLISHATQERLRTVMEKLAVIAEHRLEIYKTDHNYEVTNEVRQQLKFLEELDKMEQKRKDEAEREVLMRVVKSRSKQEDPEHLKLKEKAKAMQLAELEEMRQREANVTALAAIGPRKKPRLDAAGRFGDAGSSSNTGASSSNKGSVMLRPRVKRVNLRDLMFLLEQERESNKSLTLFKSFMK